MNRERGDTRPKRLSVVWHVNRGPNDHELSSGIDERGPTYPKRDCTCAGRSTFRIGAIHILFFPIVISHFPRDVKIIAMKSGRMTRFGIEK